MSDAKSPQGGVPQADYATKKTNLTAKLERFDREMDQLVVKRQQLVTEHAAKLKRFDADVEGRKARRKEIVAAIENCEQKLAQGITAPE
jgi:hypothetical protein